ncbi:hypothetical protein GCM10007036_34460 [Alsobacter metallidurans]|uniref:Flagellin N-terminal domain-containing protein n=1 Tax=Alsobacter metallidurans TaxID=340221 RepID=A0A917IAL9_9HYPH|nr:hypothetical protein [Alsobacter metallidurans]GGH26569.1 hypothetical protein GCM10007036_34460 [Alsobacter metallidurans]
MSITPSGYGAFSLDTVRNRQSTSRILDMKASFTDLQRQLSTGKLSDTYEGLGAGRAKSLDVRQTLTALSGYAQTIQDATARTGVADLALTRMEKIGSDLSKSLVLSAYELDSNGQTLQQKAAKSNLQETIDLLNQDYAGRSLFAGRAADKKAVTVDADTMIAGIKAAIAARKTNDGGTAANPGRLTIATAGSVVTVTAPAPAVAPAPTYGLQLSAPKSFDFSATTPTDGQSFSMDVLMPDGATSTVRVVARSVVPSPDAGAGEISFLIGGSGAVTAGAFNTAMTSAVTALTTSADFSAASSVAGAKDYFADTANWYGGDTSATPRASATARVDEDQTVGLGMEASEPAFQNLLAQLGVFAAESFSTTVATDGDRYAALKTRVSDQIRNPVVPASPIAGKAYTIQSAHTDLALGQVAVKEAKQRNTDTQAQLENALSSVEDVTTESVAAQLLAVQNQLQASYQTTSMLSKLSLVNYL